MSASINSPVAPTDWIRICATRLARRCPALGAEEVIARAIAQFRCSGALPPELAAESIDALVSEASAGATPVPRHTP